MSGNWFLWNRRIKLWWEIILPDSVNKPNTLRITTHTIFSKLLYIYRPCPTFPTSAPHAGWNKSNHGFIWHSSWFYFANLYCSTHKVDVNIHVSLLHFIFFYCMLLGLKMLLATTTSRATPKMLNHAIFKAIPVLVPASHKRFRFILIIDKSYPPMNY